MCLDTGRTFKGDSEEWIPAWKEVYRTGKRTYTLHMLFPLKRRMKVKEEWKLGFNFNPFKRLYQTGFHAWLDKPSVNPYFTDTHSIRCFIRKVTARGKQDKQRAIVGREMFIPSLRMDGTRKSQGRKSRNK